MKLLLTIACIAVGLSYSTGQTFQWAEIYTDKPNTVEADPAGNVYMEGRFFNSFTIGPIKLTSHNTDFGIESFVAKINASGAVDWAIASELDSGFIGTNTIFLQDNALSYFSYYSEHYKIGGKEVTSSYDYGLAFARIDPSGNVQSLQNLFETDDEDLKNAVIFPGKSQGFFAFVEFFNELVAGTTTITNPGRTFWIGKFASDGTLKKSRTLPYTKQSEINIKSIAEGSDGSIYIAGSFDADTLKLDQTVAIPSVGFYDPFAMKLDNNFNGIWGVGFGTNHFGFSGALEQITSISIDEDGNAYLTGFEIDETDDNLRQLLIAKISNDGKLVWEQLHGPGDHNRGSEIIFHQHDAIYVSGMYDGGDLMFNSSVKLEENGGDYNMFLLRIDSSGAAIWAENMAANEAASTHSVYDISVSNTGYIAFAGAFGNKGSATQTITLDVGSKTLSTDGSTSLVATWKGPGAPVGIKKGNGGINGITVFPNPASDALYINNSNEGLMDISIYDLNGRIVSENHFSGDYSKNKELKIHTGSLAEGLYILQVRGEQQTTRIKFVVKR